MLFLLVLYISSNIYYELAQYGITYNEWKSITISSPLTSKFDDVKWIESLTFWWRLQFCIQHLIKAVRQSDTELKLLILRSHRQTRQQVWKSQRTQNTKWLIDDQSYCIPCSCSPHPQQQNYTSSSYRPNIPQTFNINVLQTD